VLSIDTNILFYAFAADRPENASAVAWLNAIQEEEVTLSEFVMVEYYRLLRNPVVSDHPKSAAEAVKIVRHYHEHPKWRVLGFNRNSSSVHAKLWELASQPEFAYRRIFDARLALSLIDFGVTRFATRNVKDFDDFGFEEVFDPIA